jgi:hypothetical protein
VGGECGGAQGSRSQKEQGRIAVEVPGEWRMCLICMPYMYALYVCIICSKVVLRWKLQVDGEVAELKSNVCLKCVP